MGSNWRDAPARDVPQTDDARRILRDCGKTRAAPQPKDSDHVEKPEEESAEICVFGFSGEPRTVVDGHKLDHLPVNEKQGRAEPVHTRKEGQAEKSLAPEDFDSAGRVGTAVLENGLPPLFAKALAMRREFLACLLARIPATSAGPVWPGPLSLPNNLGISAGSFCPSPSIVAMIGLRAARTPVLIAALWPVWMLWRM